MMHRSILTSSLRCFTKKNIFGIGNIAKRNNNNFNNKNNSHLIFNQTLIRSVVTSPITKADAEMVNVTFVRGDGSKVTTKGKIGDSLLDVVVNNNVDLDGFGACEGTLSCSTCHLVFKKEDFDKIEEKLTDEELDMLDMAYGLCETSRLGCQVCLTKKLADLEVVVPAGVNDART